MPFSADTPEAINKIIEHGIETITNDEFDDFNMYLDKMIQRFYHDANRDIIKRMLHWARHPTLNLFTIEDLREIEIYERTKEFKNGTMNKEEYEQFNGYTSWIDCPFGYVSKQRDYVIIEDISNWNTLYKIVSNGGTYNPNRNDDTHMKIIKNRLGTFSRSYVKFIEIIQSIWNSSTIRDDMNSSYVTWYSIHEWDNKQNELRNCQDLLKKQLDSSNKIINDLKGEIQTLKNENMNQTKIYNEIQTLKKQIINQDKIYNESIDKFKEQIKMLTEQNAILQSKVDAIERKHAPELIEYDYELIKSRIDIFRHELKMTQRIFARIINSRYNVPIATAIPISSK